MCIPRAVPNPFPGDLQVERFTRAMCLQLAEVTPGLSLPLLEAGPWGAVPSTCPTETPQGFPWSSGKSIASPEDLHIYCLQGTGWGLCC